MSSAIRRRWVFRNLRLALHHHAFQQRVFAGEFFFVLPRGFGGGDLGQAAVADPVEDAGEFVGVEPQAVRFAAVDQHATVVAEVLPCHQLAAHCAGAVTLAGRRERCCRRSHQRRFDLWGARFRFVAAIGRGGFGRRCGGELLEGRIKQPQPGAALAFQRRNFAPARLVSV